MGSRQAPSEAGLAGTRQKEGADMKPSAPEGGGMERASSAAAALLLAFGAAAKSKSLPQERNSPKKE